MESSHHRLKMRVCCCTKENSVEASYEMDRDEAGPNSAEANPTKSSGGDAAFEELEAYMRKHSHQDILQRLQSVYLGDMYTTKKGEDLRTVFHTVLKNATNGDQILTEKLDECVTETCTNKHDETYALRVNLSPLLVHGTGFQMHILKDLLEFRDTAAKNLLTHPVMETFLEVKWKKVQRLFFFSFLLYFLFVLSYSLFLGNIFYRQDSPPDRKIKLSDLVLDGDKVIFPEATEPTTTTTTVSEAPPEVDGGSEVVFLRRRDHGGKGKDTTGKPNADGSDEEASRFSNKHAFLNCWRSGTSISTCAFEAILAVCIALLLIQEIFQMYALGIVSYTRELENIVEIASIALATTSLCVQHDMHVLKWVSAVGICLAYLEFIFLLGRYPFLGGGMSLMFYGITRHLAKHLINFLVFVLGFGFAFFIMNHGSKVDLFENPFKAIVRTLCMVLGEYGFSDIYDAHRGNRYELTFTMLLLVAMAIMGSLVLVNLIIALIVTNIDQLRKDAHVQELVNKAQHVIHVESVMTYLLCCWPGAARRVNVGKEVRVCNHSICKCESAQLGSEIVSGLSSIVARRRLRRALDAMSGDAATASAAASLVGAVAEIFRRSAAGHSDAGNFVCDVAEMIVEGIKQEG